MSDLTPLPGICITANRQGWRATDMHSKRTLARHATLGGLLARLTATLSTPTPEPQDNREE